MSKLGDAIRRSQRVEATPMGFGAARPAAKASLLVGCRNANVEAARSAGADFVLVSGGDIKALRAAAGDLTVGLLDGTGATASKQLRQDGADFLAFEAETTPAAALLDEELGYVLILPESPDELLLRSLEPLSFEALYLTSIPLPLTVARQIELVRIAAFARKPLLCQVAADVSSEDLQCLRAAGAVAVVCDDATAVARLKEAVLALPARKQRREDRPVVSLPRGQAPAEEDDDDDDEP